MRAISNILLQPRESASSIQRVQVLLDAFSGDREELTEEIFASSDNHGETLLHQAVRKQADIPLFAALLNYLHTSSGFAIFFRKQNHQGESVKQLAEALGHEPYLNILQRHEANLHEFEVTAPEQFARGGMPSATVADDEWLEVVDTADSAQPRLIDDDIVQHQNRHYALLQNSAKIAACMMPDTIIVSEFTDKSEIDAFILTHNDIAESYSMFKLKLLISDITFELTIDNKVTQIQQLIAINVTAPNHPQSLIQLELLCRRWLEQAITQNKFSKHIINPEDIDNLREIYTGVDVQMLLWALQQAKGNIVDVYGYLSDDKKATEKPVNIFCDLYEYLRDVCHRLKDFCLVCAGELPLSQDHKFLTCESALCRWSNEDFGLVAEHLIDYIQTHAEVLDLLISTTYAAAVSSRREQIFDPFPDAFITVNKQKDYNAVVETLNQLPAVSELARCVDECALKQKLAQICPKAYPLLKWIVTTTRAHIELGVVTDEDRSRAVRHRFTLRIASPEREVKFQQLLSRCVNRSTLFTFHGSRFENWHRILRLGIRNCSGSSLQLNGASYGSGVYLAGDFNTSLQYCHQGAKWPQTRLGRIGHDTLRIIADVQLIAEPRFKPNPYYVIDDDEYLKMNSLMVM